MSQYRTAENSLEVTKTLGVACNGIGRGMEAYGEDPPTRQDLALINRLFPLLFDAGGFRVGMNIYNCIMISLPPTPAPQVRGSFKLRRLKN